MTTLTRRRLFGLAAAGAGGLAVTSTAGARLLRRRPAPEQTSSPPISTCTCCDGPLGPTPTVVSAIKKQGRKAWLDKQLAPSTIDDSACDQLIKDRFPRVNWTIPEARDGLEPFSWDLMYDVAAATIARAAWSKRQLFEVMVDFWSNHLNVTNPSDRVWDNRQDYDRQVIRKHALGRFEDMLIASATHPAMLLYLNNADSTKDNPNENYGRELLELHTVSVDGGYNEQDMRNSTLVMTGFGVNWERGTFRYTAREHYRGPVSIMGFSDANPDADGYDVGIRYLKYLANHPSTAHHIAYKLCLRFVSDNPDPVARRPARQHLPVPGDGHRPGAPAALPQRRSSRHRSGRKMRRPFEDLLATLRVLGYGPDRSGRQGMQALCWIADEPRTAAARPGARRTGTPTTALDWQSAGGTLGRWNTHLSLAAHWWPDELDSAGASFVAAVAAAEDARSLGRCACSAAGLPHAGADPHGKRS